MPRTQHQPGNCDTCKRARSRTLIAIDDDGISGLNLSLFHRTRSARALAGCKTTVKNINPEQLARWVRPTWLHIGVSTRVDKNGVKTCVTSWLVTEYEDCEALSSLHSIAAGTRFPKQATGAVRADPVGQLCLLHPPFRVLYEYAPPPHPL